MSLYANGLRAQHHISGKTTFRTLCAPAHKVREICPPGSEARGEAFLRPYPYQGIGQQWPMRFGGGLEGCGPSQPRFADINTISLRRRSGRHPGDRPAMKDLFSHLAINVRPA
jgi:hypothetical protein